MRGRGVRRRCFLTDGARCIMPAFGAYAGGLNACDPAFRPLFPAASPPISSATSGSSPSRRCCAGIDMSVRLSTNAAQSRRAIAERSWSPHR